jgi:hypothetical protein
MACPRQLCSGCDVPKESPAHGGMKPASSASATVRPAFCTSIIDIERASKIGPLTNLFHVVQAPAPAERANCREDQYP